MPYDAVLKRFEGEFPARTVESITIEELNEFIIRLLKRGMSPNTVLHNVIIVAQFFRRNGRPGLTRELHLPEKISTLPREYSEDDLGRFFGACDRWERALFSVFLLTGMREQEVMYLLLDRHEPSAVHDSRDCKTRPRVLSEAVGRTRNSDSTRGRESPRSLLKIRPAEQQ